MYTLYKIKADELDSSFLKGLKAMFKNKEIENATNGSRLINGIYLFLF